MSVDSACLDLLLKVDEDAIALAPFAQFTNFDVIRTTTEKLAGELEQLAMQNELVRNGDAPAGDCATEVALQVTHVGGRDWVIIVGIAIGELVHPELG